MNDLQAAESTPNRIFNPEIISEIMREPLCICGAGTMGAGIALSAARHNIPVILYELRADVISRAAGRIDRELQQEVEKKRLGADEKKAIFRRIRFTGSLADCRAGIILEAIIEKSEAKVELFNVLAKNNDPETLFASNTSSLSIKAIAALTAFPERIIGMHFFNPPGRMKLVEIVRTPHLSESTVKKIYDLAVRMGKTPVICNDAPGFIVNHVARPFYLEALRLVENNVADMETIDKLVESAGFKMGPFHLMDLIGNDINYTVSTLLYEALGKPERLKPSPLQQLKVEQGDLGRKTGRGFFEYEAHI